MSEIRPAGRPTRADICGHLQDSTASAWSVILSSGKMSMGGWEDWRC
jgi:hypothetical protein